MTKTVYQEIIDAINGVIVDNDVTRDLVIAENIITRSKLSELENQLKVINTHLSLVDNTELTPDDV